MPSDKTKISITNLLAIIPDQELNRIARKTNVNKYVKVLDGKSVFYLILYSLVESRRNSLRTMEDIFNSSAFKFLFNLQRDKTVRYNSISERLSRINIELFKQSYDGNFPTMGGLFTDKKYLNEDKAIPEVVFRSAKKDNGSVFAFDRGVQERKVFLRFLKQELNFSHITSTSENGMKLMLYMTMITSMLVLIYKRANQVGYKTAVRRAPFELNEFIIKLVVKHLGGDPEKAFIRNPELDRVFKKLNEASP